MNLAPYLEVFRSPRVAAVLFLGFASGLPLALSSGTLQAWIEGGMVEGDRQRKKIAPPDSTVWNRQVQIMRVFDNLIYNTDRNMGNIVIDRNWKLWMIDHTRAFRRFPSLQKTVTLNQCERGMYQRLKTLDEAVVRERLKPYLSSYEMDALLKRRALIVERLDEVIAERGEAKVLYTYTVAAAPVQPGNPE